MELLTVLAGISSCVTGIGAALIARLKNAVIARGKLPYYGTAVSHIASQRVAVKAGFLPAWAELLGEETV